MENQKDYLNEERYQKTKKLIGFIALIVYYILINRNVYIIERTFIKQFTLYRKNI